MESRPVMKCGHTANATTGESHKAGSRIPCCCICSCYEVADVLPDLTGRKARCSGGHIGEGGIENSDTTLAFFKYCPDKPYDEYYCGCWGWN